MIAREQLRGIGVLVGLCVFGCAQTPAHVAPPPSATGPALADDCPYASVYVAVSTNGSKRDTKVARRIQVAYSDYLGERGFHVVPAPEQAYWNAFSLVRLSRRIDSTFAWAVYMMATEDLRGADQTPFDFANEDDDPSELSGFMLLKEVRLLELDLQAREAAEATAGALLPHASRMCVAWVTEHAPDTTARMEEPTPDRNAIERLRQELTQEILRVRRERQRKRLRIDIEAPSDL
jgi:hypothetical protein